MPPNINHPNEILCLKSIHVIHVTRVSREIMLRENVGLGWTGVAEFLSGLPAQAGAFRFMSAQPPELRALLGIVG